MIKVFADYDYYKNDFGGKELTTEEEFNKYGNIASMEIVANTLSRVTDMTISNFPDELIKRIKDCTCRIAELKKLFDDMINASIARVTNGSQNQTQGIAKSMTAGAVSVSYDTTATNNTIEYYLDSKKRRSIIQAVLDAYLSPIYIAGRYYNLLSKVLANDNVCRECSII